MPINKRWIAVFVAITFLFSLVPAGALVTPAQAAEQARGQISMEEALRIAKGHFAVDSRLDVFSSGFNEFDGSPRWRFNWRDSKGQFGEVSVEINAATGEVVSYHSYNPREHEDSSSRGFLPKISDEEGLKIAQGFIEKLTNRKASDFRLLPNNQQQSLQRGMKFLEYNFIGLVNGIPYPNNRLVVAINGDTGELRHFYYQWEPQGSFPTTRKIDEKQGLELIKKELEVELVYFKGFDRSGTRPIQLVYQFKNPGEIMIDAATGQLVKHGDHFFPTHLEQMKSQDSGAGGDFTPQEQLELEKMAGLINQEEARAIATKLFPQAAELNLQHSSLSRDWEFPQLVVWRFNWNRESAERFEWLEVEIDAKSGEVIGFSRHGHQRNQRQPEPENYQVKNRAEAQKLAESYIRETFPKYADSLRLERMPTEIGDKPQSEYWFRFTRLVNGIPFDKNFVNLTIDATDGSFRHMSLRWIEDLEFPRATNLKNKEQVINSFLKDNPVELQYTRVFNQELGRFENIYLVYRISQLRYVLVDAVTGQGLNFNGEPIQEQIGNQYIDIDKHWAREDINLLNSFNLLRDFAGPSFKPDAPITGEEVLKILTRIKQPWIDQPHIDPIAIIRALDMDEDIYQHGVKGKLTRGQMSIMLVDFLGYSEVSQLSIFKLDFADANRIASNEQGAVAIVHGLGLITKDSNGNIRPQREVTRAEAVTIIARLLRR